MTVKHLSTNHAAECKEISRRYFTLFCDLQSPMVDEFEILGVARDATEKEIRTAYSARMLACSRDTGVERAYDMQLVREAYKSLKMKLAHTNRHLAIRSTHEEVSSGTLCRCGSRYSLEDLQDNIIECQSCSCYVILERAAPQIIDSVQEQ